MYIAEKPSVAQEFAKALKLNSKRKDGYLETEDAIITWCVGHLVTMSYPERYDEKFKRWSLATLPFLPKDFLYEVIPGVSKQFETVKSLLLRDDVETIYVCTDSGREGEYIYRLVEQMAGVKGKKRRRVWIDSQTEEEILRGIHEAKDLSEYDNLSASAYLRAKEDYLMGINFSRLLTLKYGSSISGYLKSDRTVLSVGRVMTCVLGMVVRREREIRSFVKTPFYRVIARLENDEQGFDAEWKVADSSIYYQSPFLYKDNGFLTRDKADELIGFLNEVQPVTAEIVSLEKKREVKNPPLLFNLAELQNECAKLFKISPDETLRITQELYEKKLVTYPRTDARVLSTAVTKEIKKNLNGLMNYNPVAKFADEILQSGSYSKLASTRYVNDKQITDHYAIIPTGQGFGALRSLNGVAARVYDTIVRRFICIFYPPAVYQKITVTAKVLVPSKEKEEKFVSGFKVLLEEGYLKISGSNVERKADEMDGEEEKNDSGMLGMVKSLKKGVKVNVGNLTIKEGETTPPKRYNSGSIILAMENAGQLIEDEDLRAQIKGSGIGTSATRAEILKKLVHNKYIALNNKTQVISTTLLGEIIFDVVDSSIHHLLNPELTASWEKGLTYVAEGQITPDEYMGKLEDFVRRRTGSVLNLNNQNQLYRSFDTASGYYK